MRSHAQGVPTVFPNFGELSSSRGVRLELPVSGLQASDGEEDNERSVRRFGYNPDNGDVWGSINLQWETPCLPGI